jgi:Transcription initiation factor IIE, alpha subunit
MQILPITKVVIEVASFDQQKMMDPEISGVEYQQGELQGYETKEYLLEKWGKQREKESGWLTYYWKVDLGNAETNLKSELRRLYKNLKERLDFEKENVFYVCSSDIPCGRYTFDYASANYFTCPVCGADLESEDNTEIIEKLDKRVEELEKVIKTL